jgi:[protein-PII] uridylyltransferase
MTTAIQELKASRAELAARFTRGEIRETFQESHAEIMDQYFRRSLQESAVGKRLFRTKKPFAFVAVGGYGRKELFFHSDVDIMFLFNGKVPQLAKELAVEVLYPLWDLGLDLGHAVRGIKDCLTLAGRDFEVLASMLDARFICGESPLFLSLVEQLRDKTLSRKTTAFARWLADKDALRMETFGDASYLLEPNLKEGIGGLRDHHHILWLAKAISHLLAPRDLEYEGIFTHQEFQDLQESTRFVGLVRNHLHRLSERRNERLFFDYQERIAAILGFKDHGNELAVEGFLGRLHTHMATVKSLHRSFVLAHIEPNLGGSKRAEEDREVSIDSATSILRDPLVMMDAFRESCRRRMPLALETKRLIREFRYLVDETFRRSERAVKGFLLVLNDPNAFDALDQMLEVGFLGAFFPEFESIQNRVQYDNYHLYPVGRHSLQTLRHLKRLHREKDILLLAAFSDLKDPEPLFLASLLHDIGKTGKDHAEKGMQLTRGILKRMGYDKAGTEDVLFLVRRHLLLAETASRRDLNDEKIIVQCAATVGSIDRLKMLYLLTWADGRATGPRAWNDWVENLVQELFFKILHTLERGELATPDASRKVRQTLRKVRDELEGRIEPSDLDPIFEAMSPRYLLERKPKEIVRHILEARRLRDSSGIQPLEAFSLEGKESFPQGTIEVTFLGKDRPGLFADLAGVMALNNINILSAHIYTWRDGTAADIFTVTRPLDPMRSPDIWARIKKDLEKTFSGAVNLSERLREKAQPSLISLERKWHWQPEVRIDNEASDFFTLVEVFAEDRIGLLHQITRALFHLGLDIGIAKIATKKGRVADIFYVRDLSAEKIMDADRVQKIEKTLVAELKSAAPDEE